MTGDPWRTDERHGKTRPGGRAPPGEFAVLSGEFALRLGVFAGWRVRWTQRARQ